MDTPGFWPLFAVRLAGMISVLALVGAAIWALLIRRTPPPRRHALARAALGGSLILVLARVIELYAQTRALFSPDPIGLAELRTVATATTWGAGWQVQTAAALATLAAALLCRRGGTAPWALLGVGSLAAALAEPLTGHAMEDGWWSLPYFLQALHVLGGGLWIGSLAVLTASACRGGDDDVLARRVERFSPLALTGAGLLGVTGLATAWIYTAVPADLWSTAWGRALSGKLVLLAALGGFGYHNWQHVGPALGSPATRRRLRRSAGSELLLALALLAVTALLVALPMPAGMRR